MRIILLILILIIVQPVLADEAPELLWFQSWDGLDNRTDQARLVAMDVDGSVVVLGYAYEPNVGHRIVLQRYDADGLLQWSRIYPDLLGHMIRDLHLEPDGSAVFTSPGRDDEQELFLGVTKVDAQGELIWQHRTFTNLTGFGVTLPGLDRDSDGNWCAYGNLSDHRTLLVKLDPEGEFLWENTILPGEEFEYTTDLVFGTDGGVFVAGAQLWDFNKITRFSAAGDSLWTGLVPAEVFPSNILAAAMPDGGAVFTDNSEMEVLGIPATFTWRMDVDGNILWQGRYPEPLVNYSVEVAEMLVTGDERTIVLGTAGSTDPNFHAQCFDAQGQELWVTTLGDEEISYNMVAADLGPGDLAVAGGRESHGPAPDVFFLAGFDREGDVAWTTTWNRQPGMADRLTDVAVGPDGSIAAVGYSWTGAGNGGDQWSVLKFASPLSAAGDVPRPQAATIQAYPNPFNPMTRIRYTVAENGPVRLAVYDAAGRLVRTLVERDHVAGQHELVWYGRDDAGRAQASGTYLLRLETAAGAGSSRITLVR